MENRIELKFGAAAKDLTGNTFGRKTFEIQVKPYWKDDIQNLVIIPDTIEDIGSSFIQGIYTELKETYGKNQALEHMRLDCDRPAVKEKIEKAIRAYGI